MKVLGIFAMIDDGELDWKVIVIKADDPLASVLHDVPDIEKNLPGYITGKCCCAVNLRSVGLLMCFVCAFCLIGGFVPPSRN